MYNHKEEIMKITRRQLRQQLRRILLEEIQRSQLIKTQLIKEDISEDEISAIKGEIQKQLEPLKQAILDIAEVAGIKIQGDIFN